VIEVGDEAGLARFMNALTLFGIGFSWGGFESLALPMSPTRGPAPFPIAKDEALLRLHVGLEDPADLIADLAKALAALDAGS
jgi:cystathionine beta-lyase